MLLRDRCQPGQARSTERRCYMMLGGGHTVETVGGSVAAGGQGQEDEKAAPSVSRAVKVRRVHPRHDPVAEIHRGAPRASPGVDHGPMSLHQL